MSSAPQPPPPARRLERWLVCGVMVVVLGWYAYATQRASRTWVTREPHAYYELLTEAIVSGQTYLKLEPDPRLARLPNPWAGAQGIPRAHDATYYNGRYYIYFGVAPVILLLAPWRLLTGTYLCDGAAIGIQLAAAYLLATWFFLRCRRYFFPGQSTGWTVVGVMTLGLGSYLQYNLWGGQFYQVPIACAFACGLVAAHGVLTAAVAATPGRRAAGLALASLAWGCTVGARPNYFVGLLPLGAVAGWLWWRARRDPAERAGAWRLLAAAVAPAAVVGAGLAAYNYVRFGDILEFGLRHQFAAIDMHRFKLLGPENVLPALAAYLWSPPNYSLYYPFIRITDDTFGLLTWAPFVLWALAVPFVRGRGPAWLLAAGFCLAVGVVNLFTLLFYSYLLERYELDFAGWLMLAALLGASAVLAEVRGRTGRGARGIRLAVGLTLAWTFVHSLVHSWPDTRDWPEVRLAARVLDRAPALLERVLGWPQGPVVLTVMLPDIAPGAPEPILSTGGGRDAVYVQRVDAGHYQFGFTHRGSPGVLGAIVAATPGSTHRIGIDLGGLYPPREHPLFRDWEDAEVAVLRRRVEVQCDGKVVLRAESAFYPSDPRLVRLGTAPLISWLRPAFTGSIGPAERPGVPARASIAAGLGAGPVRLRVKFPEFKAMVGEPLVSTGRSGAGDLVYVFYLGPGRLRFAHDDWNSGQLETEAVPFDPAAEHVIEIDFGGLRPAAAPGPRTSGKFRLRFDGRELVAQDRPFHPATAAEVSFGFNAIGASTADPQFRGEELTVERLKALPDAAADSGPLALTLRLPAGRAGYAEPLVVTGRPGAGDFIYLRYLDHNRARIGYDCWGKGGPQSEDFAVAPGVPLLVQVSLGSLYPETGPAWRDLPAATQAQARSRVRVRVNGRVVLDAPAHPHPSTPAEVFVGMNPLGGSTCGGRFTGEIVRIQRVDPVLGW